MTDVESPKELETTRAKDKEAGECDKDSGAPEPEDYYPTAEPKKVLKPKGDYYPTTEPSTAPQPNDYYPTSEPVRERE